MNKIKVIALMYCLSLNFYSCSKKSEILVEFQFYHNEKKVDLKTFQNEITLLDGDNNDITHNSEIGIKKNDSTEYMSLKGAGERLIRKIVVEKDTMSLYFKPEDKIDTNLTFKIDSLTFKKGEYLVNRYDNKYIDFIMAWPKYYNEYLALVIIEKMGKRESDYKKSESYSVLTKLRKKYYISEYDYEKISPKYTLDVSNYFGKDKSYTFSEPFVVNNRKYFWQFAHKTPKSKSRKGLVNLMGSSLVDVQKGKIILKIGDGINTKEQVLIKDLKKGYKSDYLFVDANFDGDQDLLQGPYYRRTIFLYENSKQVFNRFDDLNSGRLEIDSTKNELISKWRLGSFEGHIDEESLLNFKLDGSINFKESTRTEAKKIENELYYIVTKRKTDGIKIIQETTDTLKISKDFKNYSFYEARLK